MFNILLSAINNVGSIQKGFTQSDAEKTLLENAKKNLQSIDDVITQTASYNTNIPIVFGTASLSGNIIWVGDFQSSITQTGGTSASKTYYDSILTSLFFGGQDSHSNNIITQTNNSLNFMKSSKAEIVETYKLDFAIAICEGEIDELISVKIGETELDLSKYKYRFYNGSKTQNIDPLIEKKEGVGKTPAFRGLAYIVFEQFPISEFSTSMPNFIFSVRKDISKNNEHSINQLVKGITLIPGTGEFTYNTKKITKYKVRGTRKGDVILNETAQVLNVHNNKNIPNVLLALDNLKNTFPKLEWVSLVICWFANSLDISSCNIYPACEFNDYNLITQPEEWSVAGRNRRNARLVSKDTNGNLRYGGTPSDSSVLSLLQELKNRGYKVNLLPMIMVDTETKPWRGRITGNSSAVHNFFTKNEGYNQFIKHYANLCKNYIDAFVVGTEMIGLTKINDGNGNFPAVNEFCSLAGDVRATVGSNTKLIYAADWSEYHHTDGGFYNMDKLWANPNIDYIGIDAYFPLTEASSHANITEIQSGWESGEGWDFVYNQNRTGKMPIEPKWAWKNIKWFVENFHTNANGIQTEWVPNMKKVWFIEYGFPSVDLCTNQPNVFYDPTSSESSLPRGSRGYVDYEAQANAIIATEQYWKNSHTVENKFLWTWDTRPYPFFPRLQNIWSDSTNWKYGHWVNGKAVSCYIGDIIKFLFESVGIDNFTNSGIGGIMYGMVLKNNQSVASVLYALSLLYQFRIFEKNGKIIGSDIDNLEYREIDDDFIIIDEEKQEILNFQNINGIAVKKLTINFYDVDKDGRVNHISFEDSSKNDGIEKSISVPFVLSQGQVIDIAKKILLILNSTTIQKITLPQNDEYSNISAGMVVYFQKQNFYGIVESILYSGITLEMSILRLPYYLLEDVKILQSSDVAILNTKDISEAKISSVEIIDTHNFTNAEITDGVFPLFFAFRNIDEKGVDLYCNTKNDNNYNSIARIFQNATIGEVIEYTQHTIDFHTVDEINYFDILIYGNNKLKQITDEEFWGNGNICLIGNEICSFKNAALIDENVYRISYILRKRYGTDADTNYDGKRFILFDNNIFQFNFSEDITTLYFKLLHNGQKLEDVPSIEFIPEKLGLKNWKIQAVKSNVQENGDIVISWTEQYDVKKNLFLLSKTHLQSFSLYINSVRFEIVNGVSSFVYTKKMQEEDGYTGGNLNITVEMI